MANSIKAPEGAKFAANDQAQYLILSFDIPENTEIKIIKFLRSSIKKTLLNRLFY